MVNLSESARWAAITSRDQTADGAFVYCVISTKIYCRPTCSARLPRRANVKTCETFRQAEQAGFRACKRCKPELPSYTPQDDKIQQACDTICRYSLGPENPRLTLLAQEAGLTKHHFHRLFKKKTGLTPRQFAQALRASDFDIAISTTASLSGGTASPDPNPLAMESPVRDMPSDVGDELRIPSVDTTLPSESLFLSEDDLALLDPIGCPFAVDEALEPFETG